MLQGLSVVAFAIGLIQGTPISLEVVVSDADIANNTQLFPPGDLTPLKRDFTVELDDAALEAALANNTELFLPSDLTPLRSLNVADRSTSDCGCGTAPAAGRIVAGQEVQPHSLPYQAYLQACSSRGCSMCGATLINKRYAITAMHCVESANNLLVVLGEHNIQADVETQAAKSIPATAIKRSDYNSRTIDNDIAILKLASDVVFTDNIRPACLPTNTQQKYVGWNAVVSGWGTTSEGGDTSAVLKETDQTILADTDTLCRTGSGEWNLKAGKMCAYKQGTDSCQGDSGGPLVVQEDGRTTLVGVVSYGQGCAREGNAGVYARVTHYLDWINENVADGWCGTGSSTGVNPPSPSPPAPSPPAPSPPAPSPPAPSPPAPSPPTGAVCDLTCSSVGYLTADVSLNNIPSSCTQGQCYAKDGRNLCQLFNNPCGSSQQTVSCARPCNLGFYLSQPAVVATLPANQNVVTINVGLVQKFPATCDRSTGICCSTTGADLCAQLGWLSLIWG